MCRRDRRQDLRERGVAVPQVLEIDKLRDEGVQLALVFCRRHQEQDAVQIAFLANDPLFAEEVRHDCGRHPKAQIFARPPIDPGVSRASLLGSTIA